jgi:hypothetical protein
MFGLAKSFATEMSHSLPSLETVSAYMPTKQPQQPVDATKLSKFDPDAALSTTVARVAPTIQSLRLAVNGLQTSLKRAILFTTDYHTTQSLLKHCVSAVQEFDFATADVQYVRSKIDQIRPVSSVAIPQVLGGVEYNPAMIAEEEGIAFVTHFVIGPLRRVRTQRELAGEYEASVMDAYETLLQTVVRATVNLPKLVRGVSSETKFKSWTAMAWDKHRRQSSSSTSGSSAIASILSSVVVASSSSSSSSNAAGVSSSSN